MVFTHALDFEVVEKTEPAIKEACKAIRWMIEKQTIANVVLPSKGSFLNLRPIF